LPIEAGIVVRVRAAFASSRINGSIKEPCRDTQRANLIAGRPRRPDLITLAIHVVGPMTSNALRSSHAWSEIRGIKLLALVRANRLCSVACPTKHGCALTYKRSFALIGHSPIAVVLTQTSKDKQIFAEEFGISVQTSITEIRKYAYHRKIERNRTAAHHAKKFHGTRCQACDLDFGERYGKIGQGFIEAHHLWPIATLEEGTPVKYDVAQDFAVLCSNCHRMIHRFADPSSLVAFREFINQ
jgi:hypothetical protein